MRAGKQIRVCCSCSFSFFLTLHWVPVRRMGRSAPRGGDAQKRAHQVAFILPMNSIGIRLGHAASAFAVVEQLPKPSFSHGATMLSVLSSRCGLTLRKRVEVGELGRGEQHRAEFRAGRRRHAPQPMQAAASNAVSASSFATRMRPRRGALPVGAEMTLQPDDRSNADRFTIRSGRWERRPKRHGCEVRESPSLKKRMESWQRWCRAGPVRHAVDEKSARSAASPRGSRARRRREVHFGRGALR